MNIKGYLQTGQITCHDTVGREVPCINSGQDAEFRRGIPWPIPRFRQLGDTVSDNLTELIWTRNANLAEFPLTWQESLDYISHMNHGKAFGYSDWRLPNRKELRSLMSYQTKKPALPEGHSFSNVFLGWYWTSTSAAINPAYAWYIHMEGARMFYGGKKQFFLLWPVCGKGNGVLSVTGQSECYDSDGLSISCQGTGQDAEFRFGRAWPEQRFEVMKDTVIDHLTNLYWTQKANLTGNQVTWEEAFTTIKELNKLSHKKIVWRLPNINELESLVDCSVYSPALPAKHPFEDVRESYWSSTTSMFEPDWAWALYLTKGAVGVGQKKGAHFHVWAVSDTNNIEGL
ncbi:MAG TPA: DUF1566 domain-containing protein [Bacteroidales bacterium]|nr:DUF1566 domain-containing protein [Bacteroidales bacterium]